MRNGQMPKIGILHGFVVLSTPPYVAQQGMQAFYHYNPSFPTLARPLIVWHVAYNTSGSSPSYFYCLQLYLLGCKYLFVGLSSLFLPSRTSSYLLVATGNLVPKGYQVVCLITPCPKRNARRPFPMNVLLVQNQIFYLSHLVE